MIEVSLFGALVGTLASAASLVLVLVALGASAFVVLTAAMALEQRYADLASRSLEPTAWDPRRVRKTALIAGGVTAMITLVVVSAGLQVGGFFTTGLVITAGSIAVGATGALAALLALRGVSLMMGARQRHLEALRAADLERVRHIEAGRRRYLEGADLREEVAEAQGALERLREALRSLEQVHAELLQHEVAASPPPVATEPGSPAQEGQSQAPAADTAAALASASDYARLRNDVELKLDLGRRVLTAAEVAAFRLACFEPLRRLLRRRPHEATAGLSRTRTAAELDACIGQCAGEIQAFLGELDGARAVLDALAAVRPPALSGEGGGDPLAKARAEVDAVGAAYRAVLDRANVVRMRLAARTGMEQVASAAGAVTESARSMGLEEGELKLLLDEVARADLAMTVTSSSGGAEIRALTDALARSTAALDRNDPTSLDELVKAMRELG
jgi:hypothetical protein